MRKIETDKIERERYKKVINKDALVGWGNRFIDSERDKRDIRRQNREKNGKRKRKISREIERKCNFAYLT